MLFPYGFFMLFSVLVCFCLRGYLFAVEEGDGGGDVGDRRKRYDEESTLPAFLPTGKGKLTPIFFVFWV